MEDTKNMIRGIIFTIIYIITTIVIPYLGFTWVKNLSIQGMPIQLEQVQYENIIFWIFAFGLIVSGCAFFAYSSPSQSIRRGIFSLLQVILNCFYIWSYRFSGALEVEFIFEFGSVYINLTQMILVYLGVYFLTILLKIYDVIDFTVNRYKIREEREQKLLQKEGK